MRLLLENDSPVDIRSATELLNILCNVDGTKNTYAILEADNGHFIQTANRGGGYVIEKQLGSTDEHFEAVPMGADITTRMKLPFWKRLLNPRPPASFTLDDAVDCFAAFLGERDQPAHIQWRKMQL